MDRMFTTDMNVEMPLHFFCILSPKPQRMDVCCLEKEVIIRFVLRRGQLRQSNSTLRVMGRLGGEQPGLSGRSLSQTGFSAPSKTNQRLKTHFHHSVK